MMQRRQFLQTVTAGAALAQTQRPPNIVLILCDNLGYGDIGCQGATDIRTPHVDRMAREGMRFTSFYAASGVCTPSRAALMTGCYPRRVGLHHTDPDGFVLRPVSRNGLNPDEQTIAEVLKGRGYATTIIGKWHLGDQPQFLPTRQGFDEYFGIPYSDDMVGGKQAAWQTEPWPPLPLMENERVIEAPVDRTLLTKRYTERTIDFINRHREQPFFVLLSHAMPGSTQAPFASEAFRGKSHRGAWGDAVEEIDWSTGEILTRIAQLNLDRQTLVIWTNDNGAPRHNGRNGSNLPLGGWGYTTTEGGQRVPCIARWPGTIPAGRTCDAVATLMDCLPTFAHLSGATLPKSKPIDGRNITPLLTGKSTRSPHEAFYYYYGPQLQAVRSGRWKLVLGLEKKMVTLTGKTELAEPLLFDLDRDAAETTNLFAAQPAIVRRLLALAERARTELGDMDRQGSGQRLVGRATGPLLPQLMR
jgi:arylsulfatase A-like enzyme